MNLNYILGNEELNTLLNNSINKTFYKYKISLIMDQEDFYQDVCIYIMPRLKNFDSEKSSLKTYLPLIIMSCARKCIEKAVGQSNNYNKLAMKNSEISLNYPYLSESLDCENFQNFIEDDTLNFEEGLVDSFLIEEILAANYLTSFQKTILCYMLREFSITEIAKLLKCSQGNISHQFKKIKEKIIMNYVK